ncbi:MAG: hypothetical protein J0I80_06630 [Sphingomonas sp.]|nr:hypothetical protein [Sphingomonas sp.]
MNKYLVFDVEYATDNEGHALYQTAERFDPTGGERTRDNDPRTNARWVFKQPVCISWLIMEGADGHLTPGRLETASMPELNEAEMLTRFFVMLKTLPDNVPLVSWGGSASDEPQLRLAAMRHGMAVPTKLSVPLRPRLRHGEGHIDLMTHMCSDAARVHLAEICAAFRIPAKVTAPPEAVGGLIACGKWSLVKSICENDVLSTAALLAHVVCNRTRTLSLFGALMGLARLGAERKHRPYADAFQGWVNTLIRQETQRCFEDMLAGKADF